MHEQFFSFVASPLFPSCPMVSYSHFSFFLSSTLFAGASTSPSSLTHVLLSLFSLFPSLLQPVSLSKSDPGLLVRVIPMLPYLMEDKNATVIKRVVVCIMQLYKLTLVVRTCMYLKLCLQFMSSFVVICLLYVRG